MLKNFKFMATSVKKRPGNFKQNLFILSLLLIATCGLYIALNRRGYLPPLTYLVDIFCPNGCLDNTPESLARLLVPNNQLLNYDKPITQILASNIDKNKSLILVEKSKYRQTFFYDKKPIKSYPVVFGSNPVDDK